MKYLSNSIILPNDLIKKKKRKNIQTNFPNGSILSCSHVLILPLKPENDRLWGNADFLCVYEAYLVILWIKVSLEV